MTIKSYTAVLHDGPIPTAAGQPVLCPFQPDGSPKPVVDYHGAIYRLMPGQIAADFFDYQLSEAD
ncbi:hypothetical protein MZK47_15020 [Microbacterium aerolatum]|uniref:hypothetical protein n=1 Tax=Microbacterium aerolatum TaxID=153731 RepID=UPI002001C7AA|nr:hypothetical protein [Microbacterium aerolatum]MCK3770983.1 hypothetical protein [Microbacterium aerolatum]